MTRRRRRMGWGGAAGVSYDSDALALFTAFSADPGDTRKGLYNDLIVGLKADGVWSTLDVLAVLAAHSAQAARLNIRAPGGVALSEVNTPTHTTDRGYTFSGTAHLDAGFDPAAGGAQFSQNSACIGSYVNSSSGGASSLGTVGRASLSDIFLRPRNATDALEGRVNAASNMTFGTVTNRVGGRAISRIGSADTRGYVDGVQVGGVSGIASTAVASGNMLIGRAATMYNTTDRIAAAWVGGGLAGAQVQALHTRLATFLSAIGAA